MPWTWGNIDWPQTLSGLVAIAALVQAGVAVVMVRGLKHAAASAETANAALELNRRSSETQLRAYVDIDTITVVQGPQRHLPTQVQLRMKNNGQTRATDLRMILQIAITSPEKAAIFEATAPPQEAAESVLGAGLLASQVTTVPGDRWAEAHAEIGAGTLVLVAAGTITYRDVFGHERETRYRRCLAPAQHPALMVSMIGNNFAT